MWQSWLYWIILNYRRSCHYYPQNKTCEPLHAISSRHGDKTFKWFKLTLLNYRMKCKKARRISSFDATIDLFYSSILIRPGLATAYPHCSNGQESIRTPDLIPTLIKFFNSLLSSDPDMIIEFDVCTPARSRDVVCRIHLYSLKETIMHRACMATDLAIAGSKMTLFPYLSRRTLRFKSFYQAAPSSPSIEEYPHCWGFPFALHVHYQEVSATFRSPSYLPSFLRTLDLPIYQKTSSFRTWTMHSLIFFLPQDPLSQKLPWNAHWRWLLGNREHKDTWEPPLTKDLPLDENLTVVNYDDMWDLPWL